MATTLSPAFTTLFEAEVHQAYQATAQLRNTCRMRTGVEGSSVKFPKLAAGVASVRTPSTEVVPLNGVFSSVEATMTNYVASEYSDIFFLKSLTNALISIIFSFAIIFFAFLDQLIKYFFLLLV